MTNEFNLDGKDIRFIDSHYKDLFRVPDGGCIQIHYPDETVVKPCKFIDEYHTQIGTNVFHICQFAEIMERNGASYMAEPEIMGEEAAWKVGRDRILAIQTCDDGYDYTLFDENYNEIDGGQVDNPDISMIEVRTDILLSPVRACTDPQVVLPMLPHRTSSRCLLMSRQKWLKGKRSVMRSGQRSSIEKKLPVPSFF